jgi:hypothetical protein
MSILLKICILRTGLFENSIFPKYAGPINSAPSKSIPPSFEPNFVSINIAPSEK